MARNMRLVRKQLDHALHSFRPLRDISTPSKGWIRAIRDALGMSGRQLAERLGVVRQGVARIERDEQSGSVTLKTMRKVAEGLDCVFVYGFAPRTSLEQTVRDRAKRVAGERLARVSQTMMLENQALSSSEDLHALSDMVEELVDTLPPTLWDD